MTGPDLFQRLRAGEMPERPLFLPVLTGLAARVGCVSLEEMYRDPAQWTTCLTRSAQLFDLDGVVTGYQPGLLARVCRQPDPLSAPELVAALETMRRVFHACGQKRLGVAALTGPVSLSAELWGPAAGADQLADLKPAAVKITEAVSQTRPDLLLFLEVAPGAVSPAHRRLWSTLRNVVSYYDIPVALYLEGYAAEGAEQLLALDADLYLLGPSLAADYDEARLLEKSRTDALAVGLGLPAGDPERAVRLIELGMELQQARGEGGLFFTSYEPTAGFARPEELQALIAEIYRVGREIGPVAS